MGSHGGSFVGQVLGDVFGDVGVWAVLGLILTSFHQIEKTDDRCVEQLLVGVAAVLV